MENTVDTLKQELVDHLHSIDKTRLCMFDLKVYADIVKNVWEMSQSNYMETLMKRFSDVCEAPAAKPVPMKDGETNG